jgi:hypothetical protein
MCIRIKMCREGLQTKCKHQREREGEGSPENERDGRRCVMNNLVQDRHTDQDNAGKRITGSPARGRKGPWTTIRCSSNTTCRRTEGHTTSNLNGQHVDDPRT